MKTTVQEDHTLLMEEIYNPITLKTAEGEILSICMRDSGFEFTYQGNNYSAQKGIITYKLEEPPLVGKEVSESLEQKAKDVKNLFKSFPALDYYCSDDEEHVLKYMEGTFFAVVFIITEDFIQVNTIKNGFIDNTFSCTLEELQQRIYTDSSFSFLLSVEMDILNTWVTNSNITEDTYRHSKGFIKDISAPITLSLLEGGEVEIKAHYTGKTEQLIINDKGVVKKPSIEEQVISLLGGLSYTTANMESDFYIKVKEPRIEICIDSEGIISFTKFSDDGQILRGIGIKDPIFIKTILDYTF